MKCKQCGTENKDGAFLCSSCGYVFNNAEDMFLENEKTINAEASHKQSQIEEIKKRRDQKKKRKKIKKLILLVIAVLVVVGAVAASFYVSDKKDKEISDNRLKPAENISTPVPEQPEEPINTEEVEQILLEEQVPVVEQTEPEEQTVKPEEPVKTEKSKEATKKQSASKKTEASAPAAQKAEPKKTNAPVKTSSTTQQTKKAGITATLVDVVKTVSDENGSFIVASTNGKTVYIQGASAENNSYAIISAEASGVTVDNIPVYNVTELKAVSAAEFIMPSSSFKLLTEADIAGFSVKELRLARNEIYARHGRTFKDSDLNEYFKAKSWYKVNSSYNYKNDVLNINETENINAHFLLAAERKLSGE